MQREPAIYNAVFADHQHHFQYIYGLTVLNIHAIVRTRVRILLIIGYHVSE